MDYVKIAIQRLELIVPNNYMEFKNDEKFEISDSNGFRYLLSRQNLASSGRRNTSLNRFFRGNPFTEHNLRIFIDMNYDNLELIDYNNANNAHSKVILRSNDLDIEYERCINSIISLRGEKKNRRVKKRKRSVDWINPRKHTIEYVKAKAGEYGIVIVSNEYIDNSHLLDFICDKHPEKGIQSKTWANIRCKKYSCKYCAREQISQNNKLKHADFLESIRGKINPNIELLEEYSNANKYIKCKCNKCGKEIELRPDHIRRGIGCGRCNNSIGENRIAQYLSDNNIKFEQQYKFQDCIRNTKTLPFDFYLPEFRLTIEFDGIQHFKPVDKFGGEESYKELVANDRYKDDYCFRNNINIIRISYKDINNIPKLLSEYLD